MDEHGNSFNGKCAILENTNNCLIQMPKYKITVIKGLSNYIVVYKDNVLLVYPKDLEQEIKVVSFNIGKD